MFIRLSNVWELSTWRSRRGHRVTLNLKYISTVISSHNDSQQPLIHWFANHNNLLSLPRHVPQRKLSLFVCSLINLRSIRNKTLLIQDFVVDNLVDVLIITKTWFSCCGDVVIIGEICHAGYQFFNQPRVSRNGGGVGLLESLSIGRFWCHGRQNTGGDWIDNGVLGVKFFT